MSGDMMLKGCALFVVGVVVFTIYVYFFAG